MAINLDDYTCEFCGRPYKNLVYAAFVCDDPECLEKARIARGGPGGHMKRKAEGKPIIPEGLEEVAEELKRKEMQRTGRRVPPMTEIDVKAFVKKKPVLFISFVLAVCSFAINPTLDAFGNIRYKVLGILFIFMAAMAGLKACGVFESVANGLANRTNSTRKLALVLVALPYFASMGITNDVALLVFVPLSITILMSMGLERIMIPVLALQTLAVNVGCMITPFGNPHNLFVFTEYDLSVLDVTLAVLPYMAVGTVLLALVMMTIKDDPIPRKPDYMRGEYSKVHLWASFAIFAMGVLTVLGFLPYWACVVVALAVVLVIAWRDLLDVNYGLILTFVCLFIFTSNIASWETLANALADIIAIDPLTVTALVSQVTCNLPATVLLNGFTDDWYGLLVGSDVGGFGGPIASMASLITLEAYSNAKPGTSRKYLRYFLGLSILMFVLLIATHVVLMQFGIGTA